MSLCLSDRDLDAYLWLAGVYRAWCGAEDRNEVPISDEVRELFLSSDEYLQADLRELLGED
jgi:hypothetical protein